MEARKACYEELHLRRVGLAGFHVSSGEGSFGFVSFIPHILNPEPLDRGKRRVWRPGN